MNSKNLLLLLLYSCAPSQGSELKQEKPLEQSILQYNIEPDQNIYVCDSEQDIQKLVKKYGLNLDDVISLAAIAKLESSGPIQEDGAVMRVAYNRARNSNRTIRQVITACDWNCDNSYKTQIKNHLAYALKDQGHLLEAIDFLLGRGAVSEGAYQCDCRIGFFHPKTRKQLWGYTQDPSWAKNKVKIGEGMFALPKRPCPEYPRRR